MLYKTSQERLYAYLSLSRFKAHLQLVTPETPAPSTRPSTFIENNTDEKLAQNIATRFKSPENFTRKHGEETDGAIENSVDATNDHGL